MCSCVALSHSNPAINLSTLLKLVALEADNLRFDSHDRPPPNASPQDVVFLRAKTANRTFVLDRTYHVAKERNRAYAQGNGCWLPAGLQRGVHLEHGFAFRRPATTLNLSDSDRFIRIAVHGASVCGSSKCSELESSFIHFFIYRPNGVQRRDPTRHAPRITLPISP